MTIEPSLRFYDELRRALLQVVDVLERMRGIEPRTAELRQAVKWGKATGNEEDKRSEPVTLTRF